MKARCAVRLLTLLWPSERAYSSLSFKLYSRSGSFEGHTDSPNGWTQLFDTTLTNVHRFTGDRSQLNQTVLPSPVMLAAGEEVSLYIATGQNCGVEFGATDIISSSSSTDLQNQHLTTFPGPVCLIDGCDERQTH